MSLQRSLQNGRHLFASEYSLSAPQRGQATLRGFAVKGYKT
jgi:hypothetical protein